MPHTTLSGVPGGLIRRGASPDSPEVAEARRDLAVDKLQRHIEKVVATLPGPTAAQRVRLATLLLDGAA